MRREESAAQSRSPNILAVQVISMPPATKCLFLEQCYCGLGLPRVAFHQFIHRLIRHTMLSRIALFYVDVVAYVRPSLCIVNAILTTIMVIFVHFLNLFLCLSLKMGVRSKPIESWA